MSYRSGLRLPGVVAHELSLPRMRACATPQRTGPNRASAVTCARLARAGAFTRSMDPSSVTTITSSLAAPSPPHVATVTTCPTRAAPRSGISTVVARSPALYACIANDPVDFGTSRQLQHVEAPKELPTNLFDLSDVRSLAKELADDDFDEHGLGAPTTWKSWSSTSRRRSSCRMSGSRRREATGASWCRPRRQRTSACVEVRGLVRTVRASCSTSASLKYSTCSSERNPAPDIRTTRSSLPMSIAGRERRRAPEVHTQIGACGGLRAS